MRRLLSVCAWCKKIRGADERWVTLEEYLTAPIPLASARPFAPAQPAAPGQRSQGLSHGICPTCLVAQFPDAQ